MSPTFPVTGRLAKAFGVLVATDVAGHGPHWSITRIIRAMPNGRRPQRRREPARLTGKARRALE